MLWTGKKNADAFAFLEESRMLPKGLDEADTTWAPSSSLRRVVQRRERPERAAQVRERPKCRDARLKFSFSEVVFLAGMSGQQEKGAAVFSPGLEVFHPVPVAVMIKFSFF